MTPFEIMAKVDIALETRDQGKVERSDGMIKGKLRGWV